MTGWGAPGIYKQRDANSGSVSFDDQPLIKSIESNFFAVKSEVKKKSGNI